MKENKQQPPRRIDRDMYYITGMSQHGGGFRVGEMEYEALVFHGNRIRNELLPPHRLPNNNHAKLLSEEVIDILQSTSI